MTDPARLAALVAVALATFAGSGRHDLRGERAAKREEEYAHDERVKPYRQSYANRR